MKIMSASRLPIAHSVNSQKEMTNCRYFFCRKKDQGTYSMWNSQGPSLEAMFARYVQKVKESFHTYVLHVLNRHFIFRL